MDANAITTIAQHVVGLLTGIAYIWQRAKAVGVPGAKPGYATTSFWLTTVLNALPALKDLGLVH